MATALFASQAAKVAGDGSTSITINTPLDGGGNVGQAGDALILFAYCPQGNVGPFSGAQSFGSIINGNGTTCGIYQRPITLSNPCPASITFTGLTNANDYILEMILVSQPCSPTLGYETSGSNYTVTGSGTSIPAASITSSRTPSEFLVNCYFANKNGVITNPASQTLFTSQSQTNAAGCIAWEMVNTPVAATGTIVTNGTNVTAGDTVTIAGRVYTFRNPCTTEGDVKIGAFAPSSLTNLQHAINNSGGVPGTDYVVATANSSVTASAVVTSNTLPLTCVITGAAGNAVTLAKVAVTLTVSGATLTGGVSAIGATGTRTATAAGSGYTNLIGMSMLFPMQYGTIATNNITANPYRTMTNWWSNNVSAGTYGMRNEGSIARMMPVWLFDSGVGPMSSTPGSSNITASSMAVVAQPYLATDTGGVLSGWVRINGVNVVGCKVFLYYRPTGGLVRRAYTGADGTFQFTGLDRSAVLDRRYFAVAVDPDGYPIQYNSMVWDRLLPV